MVLALGFYDYVTFSALIFILVGFMGVVLFFLGLPGRIAKQRNHPDADAVNMMGWLGFLGVVPWIQALIWAIKETDVVDIRRFPPEESEVLKKQAEKFQAESTKKPKAKQADSQQGDSQTQD
ncbi:DUF3302 domain-containing protein [Aeoliella sp.]|uniref:DUF3302 domain-containing protein n=1 Tax=Aeoliella sp. TaxID=2795800 RepID=UPI003CCB995F